MERHTASFLSCARVARWLTDVTPPTAVHREMLGAARVLHCRRCPPAPLGAGDGCAPTEPEVHSFFVADVCAEHGHVLCFAHGAVLGTPNGHLTAPSVGTRFVIDAGRRAAMLFAHADDGSTSVAVDCYDEAGDMCSDVRHFAARAAAPLGAFPSCPTGTAKLLHKRNCVLCADGANCRCGNAKRIRALVAARRRARRCGRQTVSDDGRETTNVYPAWQQALDAYVDARRGSYVVQVSYSPLHQRCSKQTPPAYQVAYRATCTDAPTDIAVRIRREVALAGCTPLGGPHAATAYHGPKTMRVDAHNAVSAESNSALVDDWRALPGLRYDYLLHAPVDTFIASTARRQTRRIVTCENKSTCAQPASLCVSFGALTQPPSPSAQCDSVECSSKPLAPLCHVETIKPVEWLTKPTCIKPCTTPITPLSKRPRSPSLPIAACSSPKRTRTTAVFSPGSSWDDDMLSSSLSSVEMPPPKPKPAPAPADACCPEVPVGDDWELPSRELRVEPPSVVCLPVDRPPSPCMCVGDEKSAPSDTITGDVYVDVEGTVRESNQKAVFNWLTREAPFKLPMQST